MRERFVRPSLRFLITAATMALVAIPALAEEPEQPKQPIGYFELNGEVLTKYAKAAKNLAAAGEGLQEALQKQGEPKESDGSVDAIIATMTEGCEKAPPFQRAVDEAGLSCRDFTLLNITLMQATILSAGYQAEGEKFLDSFHAFKGKHLRANVEFAIEHKEEIEKLTVELQKIFEKK